MEVNSPGKERYRLGSGRERDLCDNLEQRREHDLRHKLVEQQYRDRREEASRADWHSKGKGMEWGYDGKYAEGEGRAANRGEGGLHGLHGRRKGKFRRKHRDDMDRRPRHESRDRFVGDNRKRRPKQVWVAKGE